MAVKDWIRRAGGLKTWEAFDGEVWSGVEVGSPSYVRGVDGQALSCGPSQGAVVETTASVSRSLPVSTSVWFRFPSGGGTADIFRWGNIPSMGAFVYGRNSVYPAGTVEAWVRMSSGGYAMRARTAALAPDRWHLLTIAVEQTTIWGGCRGTLYVNGRRVAATSLSGGLFNLMNFNRPRQLTVGVSDGPIVVDELICQEWEVNEGEHRDLYESAASLDAGSLRPGWGVVF